MQFHPTTLYPTGILMTEGCRGEGAYLLNADGERFMKRYAPNAMELASRDVVSRSEQSEIDEGRGINGSVMLDMRHLGAERIIERLPGSRELAMTFAGVDPIYDPVPGPAGRALPHGRRRDRQRRRDRADRPLRGGRVACVSVHGANRLGGNSLMETITFGRRSASPRPSGRSRTRRSTCRSRSSATPSASSRRCSTASEGERPWQIRDELGELDARELRRLPPRGEDAAPDGDHRGPPRALPRTSTSRTRATSSTTT